MILSILSDVELLNIIEFTSKCVDNLKPEANILKIDKTRQILVIFISIALFLLCFFSFFSKTDDELSSNIIYELDNDEILLSSYSSNLFSFNFLTHNS